MTRRISLYRFLISFAVLAAVTALPVGAAKGQKGDAAAKDADNVPVQRIVLFTSGVGYFEHQGKIDGNAQVELKFNVDDVNDLLKSMVLQDLGGGRISTVTYGSRDPITKTLQTFAIDLTNNPTLGQLLAQIRGEQIELQAPSAIRGTIVGIETQKQPVGENQVVDVEYLNLLTEDGLRRIALEAVGRIKLATPELDAELRRALEVLALGHATDKKSVTLEFLGDGEREVRIGYIQEAPLWKTSYRLVLDDEEKPFLQGWAIVENTTDADWNDVRLSLVSGRPISFVMDLYSPLYAQRPVVVPELYASLRPRVYEQDLSMKQAEFEAARERYGRSLARRGQAPATTAVPRSEQRAVVLGGALQDQAAATPSFSAESLSEGVQTAAQGADVGELFQYDIQSEVTLPRQRSAMLPIINEAVEGKKVSIYNASVQAKHPLNGVQLKNSSELHLMQGPVTVFDGGVYAGDARIPDLPPDSERLLSYALDLDVEVAPTSDARPQHLVSARIEKGVVLATYKQSRTQSYTIKNSGLKVKTVLVEHPLDPRWELRSPAEPTEKTRDMYRFAVEAKPGEPEDLKIDEEQIIRQTVALDSAPDEAIRLFLSSDAVSDTIKKALREVVQRKSEIAELARQKQQIEAEIATIGQEQQRIRENMQAIARNSDLYNRYVTKFTEQEDRIEELREEDKSIQEKLTAAQQSLTEFLRELELR